MMVAGVMSGTSADGINVALVDIAGRGFRTRFRLLAHYEFPFSVSVRKKILSVMDARSARVADLSQLNFLLGELYAGAVLQAKKRSRIAKLDLVGCHGQTIYHHGEPTLYLGHKIASTWQTGEGAVVAARVGAPVVSDFRTADMAAGGKGAPLVPYLDYLLYRDRRVGRIVQNLGGIGNLSAIPPSAAPEEVVAFDTGPGNMVIDAVMERRFGQRYDRDGRVAARGTILEPVLAWAMRGAFFRQAPPKTAGREQFGRGFVAEFLRRCRRARKEDAVATATALTARTIGHALRQFVIGKRSGARNAARYADYIISGGGTKNPTLMRMIAAEVAPLGLRVRRTDEFGLPSEAKEAVAFAVLAYQTWHGEPSNIPSATGAKRPAVLGKVSYA
jgi:anhydro-N-acetylmuramic acid kinase